MLDWISAQPPTVAAFFGTLAGSSFGLVALLIGALVNASLNRARDDRLQEEEARSIRSALTGELSGIQKALNTLADQLEESAPADETSVLIPDVAKLVRVMPLLLPKFGLLSPDSVRLLIEVYATVDQIKPTLLAHGGSQHSNDLHTVMPIRAATRIAAMARRTSNKVQEGISILNAPAK